jgi:Methyltransferase FkbM domain
MSLQRVDGVQPIVCDQEPRIVSLDEKALEFLSIRFENLENQIRLQLEQEPAHAAEHGQLGPFHVGSPKFLGKRRIIARQSGELEVVSFGDFCRRESLENLCVKIDIEGAEFDFLEGAREELHRVAFLIIEVLGPTISKGSVRALQEASEAYYITTTFVANILRIRPSGTWRRGTTGCSRGPARPETASGRVSVHSRLTRWPRHGPF